MGDIAEDGTYSLKTFDAEDGALLGEHRVTIKATRVHFANAGGAPVAIDSPVGQPRVEWLVPQRYENSETTPLTATVQRGENSIDFNLPAD